MAVLMELCRLIRCPLHGPVLVYLSESYLDYRISQKPDLIG